MKKQEMIEKLKKEKDAVILAHYYVSDEVQEIADYIGDSFYLSKIATELNNKIIVFCGVSFMGESGKLLNPDKVVLMPDINADCPMAHMVTKKEIDAVREQFENLAVVCYINSTAEIKSWADVCVTSANAVQIVRNLPNKNILFIPDRNLGRYVKEQVPEKNIILVKGYCPIHEEISLEEIQELKRLYPQAKILVHPECNKEVSELADYIGSTTGILNYAEKSDDKEFIIATEIGVEYELRKQNPGKRFYFPKTKPICKDMKKITLDNIVHVLTTEENQINVENSYAEPSKVTLERMLSYAK